MSGRALIVTYHAIERGPPPLFLEPSLFREHLEGLLACGARPVTLERIVAGLAAGDMPERAVALTFDDGFLSVAEHAVPLLVEHGVPATLFCVAGHLGGANDWSTQPPWIPRRPLADGGRLAELAASGIAIGSHGASHAPLSLADDEVLHEEIVSAREVLEQAVGAPVPWFAYPYGSLPPRRARCLVERTYAAAFTGVARAVGPGAHPFELPRVDAHYLRDPRRLAAAIRGRTGYTALRRTVARARRVVRRDWR